MAESTVVKNVLPPGTVDLSIALKSFLEMLKPHFDKDVTGIEIEQDTAGSLSVKLTFVEKNSVSAK